MKNENCKMKNDTETFRHHRRQFLQAASGLVAGAVVTNNNSVAKAAAADGPYPLAGRLFKTLKIGMIKVQGSLADKFAAAKQAGFAGVEMNAPKMDVEETKDAIAKSGLPVDGTVCGTHWAIRHTSPDAATRA